MASAASSGDGGSGKGAPPCTKIAKFDTCLMDPCMIDPCNPEPTVVIIGAGMAGLSAAHRLAQCGLKNFTVLEATDRFAIFLLIVFDLVIEIQRDQMFAS